MPYITKSLREVTDEKGAFVSGELNYEITMVIKNYIDRVGISYQTFNNAVGALECAKLELYRRMVAPYEDKKIEENGDVY